LYDCVSSTFIRNMASEAEGDRQFLLCSSI
jgi:hypothetical protein